MCIGKIGSSLWVCVSEREWEQSVSLRENGISLCVNQEWVGMGLVHWFGDCVRQRKGSFFVSE